MIFSGILMNLSGEQSVLLSASGRTSVAEAVLWFGEGHPIVDDSSPQRVLRHLIPLPAEFPGRAAAIRALSLLAFKSDIDLSHLLFETERIPSPQRFRAALDALAFRSPTKTLVGMSAESVAQALRDVPEVLECLAIVAGFTSKELRRRLGSDAPVGESWTPRSIRAAWIIIDETIRGIARSPLADAVPLRPVELLAAADPSSGWRLIEQMRVGGVPYETLLVQRSVGSAWGQHRNATSSSAGIALSSLLTERLRAEGVRFVSRGDALFRDLSPIGKHAAVVTTDPEGAPLWSVVISVATDSGTASKTAAKLRSKLEKRNDVALLVVGNGWAERVNETAELVEAVGGRVFSDQGLDALVALLTTAP